MKYFNEYGCITLVLALASTHRIRMWYSHPWLLHTYPSLTKLHLYPGPSTTLCCITQG